MARAVLLYDSAGKPLLVTGSGGALHVGDDQATGWLDNGSETGVQQVKPVGGNLVPLPIHDGTYDVLTPQGSTSTVILNTQTYPSNEDGSGSGLLYTVAPGVGMGVGTRHILYGSKIGVRWRRDTAAPPFYVIIDGTQYSVTGAVDFEGTAFSATDTECLFVVADDLGEGRHTVQVWLAPDMAASGAVTRSLVLYGFAVEARAGYQPKPRLGNLIAAVTLTTSYVAIFRNSGNLNAIRGVRKLIFTNISGASATVTVRNNIAPFTIWQKAIAAADSTELDFGVFVALDNSYQYAASAANAINVSIVGGQ